MAIVIIFLALTIYFIGVQVNFIPEEAADTTPEIEHVGPTSPPHSEGPDGPPPIQ
jgi:Na+-transporting methylmalonyl-CoA/oxaloacetate decarboxylase gamma subunit